MGACCAFAWHAARGTVHRNALYAPMLLCVHGRTAAALRHELSPRCAVAPRVHASADRRHTPPAALARPQSCVATGWTSGAAPHMVMRKPGLSKAMECHATARCAQQPHGPTDATGALASLARRAASVKLHMATGQTYWAHRRAQSYRLHRAQSGSGTLHASRCMPARYRLR